MAEISHGMNIEQVEELGRLLKQHAVKLQQLSTTIQQRVNRADAWKGQRANQFRNSAWPQHRTRLQQLSRDLDGFGQSALNNAAEQRTASGERSAGAGGGAAGGGAGGGRGLFQRAATIAEGVDLITGLKDNVGVIKNVFGPKTLLDGGTGGWKAAGLTAAISVAKIAGSIQGSGWSSNDTIWATIDGVGKTGSVVAGTAAGGPLGGLAAGIVWDGSTFVGGAIGNFGYNAIESAWSNGTHTSVGAWDSVWLMRTYGVSDLDQLPFDVQTRVASEMVERREGWTGVFNMGSDTFHNTWFGLFG